MEIPEKLRSTGRAGPLSCIIIASETYGSRTLCVVYSASETSATYFGFYVLVMIRLVELEIGSDFDLSDSLLSKNKSHQEAMVSYLSSYFKPEERAVLQLFSMSPCTYAKHDYD